MNLYFARVLDNFTEETITKIAGGGFSALCVLVVLLCAFMIYKAGKNVTKNQMILFISFMVMCVVLALTSAASAKYLAENNKSKTARAEEKTAEVKEAGKTLAAELASTKDELEKGKTTIASIQSQVTKPDVPDSVKTSVTDTTNQRKEEIQARLMSVEKIMNATSVKFQ